MGPLANERVEVVEVKVGAAEVDNVVPCLVRLAIAGLAACPAAAAQVGASAP